MSQHSMATRRHHYKSLSTKRSCNPGYDPELAACMDRWIRVVFPSQRRMQSTLVKPDLGATTSGFSIADISSSSAETPSKGSEETLIHQQQPSQPPCSNLDDPPDIPERRLTYGAQKRFARFYEAMDRIPIEGHELPPSFRVFMEGHVEAKPILSETDREAINKLWRIYWKLWRDDLSRQEYERLMDILRYCTFSEEGAKRILTVQRHMRSKGVKLSSRMYEMVLQAHIILGTVQESIPTYLEATVLFREGSEEHRRMLWTIVDTFAGNRRMEEGITFLDQLPIVRLDEDSLPFSEHSLYRRLFSSSTLSYPPPHKPLGAIQQFIKLPWIPQHADMLRLLNLLETHSEGKGSIQVFSKSCAGMLIKLGNVESVMWLVRSLVLSRHLEEAARVMDLSLWHGLDLDVDLIRLHILESLDNQRDPKRGYKKDILDAMDRWDAIATQHSRPSIQNSSDHTSMATEYSRLVSDSIQRNDIQGALHAARYIQSRGWTADGIDFHRLCSFMVNHSESSDYLDFLKVGYVLHGPVAFSLHTYRRLVYAACRRSDLYSAIALLDQVRKLHSDWKLDATMYNAIISTAAVIKRMWIAEKMFECLVKDGIQPDHYSFHALLHGYGQTKDLQAALRIPEKMMKLKVNPTTMTFNLLMKTYLHGRKDLSTSRRLLRLMKLSGNQIQPDLVTFNQLLDSYRRVGNNVWFDAFFDKHFGLDNADKADQMDGVMDLTDPHPQESEPSTSKKDMGIVLPEKSDDRTLLIQLRYSLALPNVDLQTIHELWRMVKPKLLPPPDPSDNGRNVPESLSAVASDNEHEEPGSSAATPFDNDNGLDPPQSSQHLHASSITSQLKAAGDTLPPTHVPFKRWLGPARVPATDKDYFRFTVLTSFRYAFRSRGDVSGIKMMDQYLAELFPEHPLGEAIRQMRLRKNVRMAIKKRASSSQQKNAKALMPARKTKKASEKGSKVN